MIYVVERFVERHLHVLANVTILRILSKIYGEKIVFFAESLHLGFVRSHLSGNDNIEYKPYTGTSVEKKTPFFQVIRVLNRLVRDFFFFIKLFKNLKNEKVFITHIYPLSFPFICLIKALYRSKKVYFFMHGEVEYIFYSKGLYQKVIGLLYRLGFKLSCGNTFFIFLTSTSKDVILRKKLLNQNQIIEIELPTFPDQDFIQSCSTNENQILISHIGSSGLRKHVDKFYDLANLFYSKHNQANVVFSIVGTLEKDLQPFMNSNVINYVKDEIDLPLERELFIQKVLETDYSIFFYAKHDFQLRSPAAFFDVIYYEKPFFALENDFLIKLMEKHGAMGYICSDVSDMSDKISKICKVSAKKEYDLFLDNIRNYKRHLNIENVSEILREQLNNPSL